MKDGYIRIAAIAPAVRVANPRHNAAEAVRLAKKAAEAGARIAVFPELCLTAYTCGELFRSATLLGAAEEALASFIEETRTLDMLSVIGVPVPVRGALYNCAALVQDGRLVALVPKSTLPRPDAFHEGACFSPAPAEPLTVSFAGRRAVLGARLLFPCCELPSLVLAVEIGTDADAPIPPSSRHAVAGATLIVRPGATPEGVAAPERRRTQVLAQSRRLVASYVYADAGIGESATDAVFAAHRLIASHGELLAEAKPFADEPILYADVDTDRTVAERMRVAAAPDGSGYDEIGISLPIKDTALLHAPSRFPFVPDDAAQRDARCAAILDMQARALATRLERSHARRAVLGISGGLDSTLAALVAVRAMDILGRDRKEVVAVTMPCFGTTARTKSNAEVLTEQLGATLRTVDIKAAVSQHFADIGQPSDRYDVVYENAQARERTQVLMDIANAEGGLVVGTGDLSELALGWATYNGDHMSMYAVNGGVPKTLIRHIVDFCAVRAEAVGENTVAAVLRDILATPVSPELLPPKEGEIAQCTEGIVGPYELHDFFLYYTLRYGFAPSKTERLANAAFRGVYDEATVHAWLAVFERRFIQQQFKRSCLPDGPSVGSVSVSPRAALHMPSDADASAWILQ